MTPLVRRAALAGVVCGALALTSACAGPSTAGAGDYAGAGSGYDAGAPADDYAGPPSSAPPAAAAPPVARAALIAKTIPKMGAVVTDAKGWVLYRFDKDPKDAQTSACNGTCASVWPPAVTDGKAPVLRGVDAAKVGMVRRADGRWQLTLGGWLLYRYAGDRTPGQWKGQGVGGTWWVSAPTGAKNLTCVPKGVPKAVPPPVDDDY